MIRSTLFAIGLLVAAEPVLAQGNDNDYTPLNSRIRRDRQFPTEPNNYFDPGQMTELRRTRSRSMIDHLASCLWNRSNEKGIDLLARTDFGFVDFMQIGIPNSEVAEHYAVETCLDRVASRNNSGVRMRFNAQSMRLWYIQAAYFDRYEDGPSWIVPGNVIAPRSYPLSANNNAIHVAMDFADCVVSQDPHAADFFFRTPEGSDEEDEAIPHIVPALSPCIPEGQELDISPTTLRVWLGEGLWHAANNSAPPPVEETQEP